MRAQDFVSRGHRCSRILREARVGGKPPMDPTTFVVDEIGRIALKPLQLGLTLFCRFDELPEVIHMV
jgi:hypothetical protein